MTLIQYIIVRADLMKVLKWNIGAVITQACHAVAAINESSKGDDLTQKYLSAENIDSMHKCVLVVSPLWLAIIQVMTAISFRFLIKTPSRVSTRH